MNSIDSTCSCAFNWKPHNILDIPSSDFRFVLLILNQPIYIARDHLLLLWNRASLRVTVDGGTNRWFKFLNGAEYSPPELITGDMDSADGDILSHFKNLGSEIIRTPDQNETDFTKALREVSKRITVTGLQVDGIVAVCENSGRLDQILTNINTLHKAKDIVGDIPVFLWSSACLNWLLRPGMHYIHVGQKIVDQGRWCSLIPVGARVDHVTTTGLKWNLVSPLKEVYHVSRAGVHNSLHYGVPLSCKQHRNAFHALGDESWQWQMFEAEDNQRMQFGELISSSNTYSGDPLVTVQTDGNLLWSIGLKDDDP